MPETRRSALDDDALAIRLVALLKEDTEATQMRKLFYPQELVDVRSSLTVNIECITEQLNVKDVKIDQLEKRES